ncbi:hypothetical protein G6553_20605, partial [Nocardioides sp. IC4_145]|uniref:hypothetical protein n=1 Tax=Nocardioides sp. IC4_145 TaxID=2714037 RepID=UPI001A98028D
DQRMPLFEAFADEIGYTGDLSHARMIYNRAKQVRDFVGHSLSPDPPTGSGNGSRLAEVVAGGMTAGVGA